MTLQLALALLLTALCLAAGWLDVTTRRLPNWLCAVTLLAGLAPVAIQGAWPQAGSQAAHAGLALVAGMILFRFNVFGGGDAKFYAAVAAWFSLEYGLLLLTLVSLAGLVLLFGWFGYRRMAGKPVRAAGGTGFDALPYGLAIGAGAVSAYLVAVVQA